MTERPGATSARCVALTTAGAGGSSPILFASGPVGDALLSTGLMTLAGSAAASMVPVLPVRMSGIEIHETLHRFDTGDQGTEPGHTVTAANRTGEVLGTIATRWLVAPDGFEAMPSLPPPATELDPSLSQRFVMHDGVVHFQDRANSGLQFFGAGRTFPTYSAGATRLLFAGVAVVLEGLGALKNLRGSLTIAGEISARTLVSLTVSGRFDDDGPLEVVDRLAPMFRDKSRAPEATVFALFGESLAPVADGALQEVLRSARIDSDLANGAHPRSFLHVGDTVGRVTGVLAFDPAERRCAVRLPVGRLEFALSDRAGQTIATFTAGPFEGTSLRDRHAGAEANRVVAYGPLSAGSGALADVAGVLMLDTVVASEGGTSSAYTLWLADPEGRFRTARPDAEAPAAEPLEASSRVETPSTGGAGRLQFDDAAYASVSPEDLAILSRVEQTLVDGNAMLAWFHQKEETGDYMECFDVPADAATTESFGFFDTATTTGTRVPVMGIVRETFYDRERTETVEAIRLQLRAFVLRYFLRVCGGYHQVFYEREDGRVGRFAAGDQAAIVDLREIGPAYRWITLKTDIATVDVPFAPFGTYTPRLEVPVQTPAYLVVGPAFVTDLSERRKGVAAEYGFGYALMPWGNFHTAIQTVRFRLLMTGEIRVHAALIVNRLERIAAVDVDPIGWGMQMADLLTFQMASRMMSPMLALADKLPLRASGVDPVSASIWMANALTGGAAEKRFGISKAALEKRMLLQHFKQHEDMLHRSLQVWRMVPDWTADEQLPEYCRKGLA